MSFRRTCAALATFAFALLFTLPTACGEAPGSGNTPPAFKDGTLYLVIDFDKKEFDFLSGSVPLWTQPFVTEESDVADWVEAMQSKPPGEAEPITENILLSSRSQLTDSVMAIVSEASGFNAALLQRQFPARFILRWQHASLDIESPAHGKGSTVRTLWQDARTTARRLFGEEQLKVTVDSVGALTLQRAARPPMLTIVRPPRKH